MYIYLVSNKKKTAFGTYLLLYSYVVHDQVHSSVEIIQFSKNIGCIRGIYVGIVNMIFSSKNEDEHNMSTLK